MGLGIEPFKKKKMTWEDRSLSREQRTSKEHVFRSLWNMAVTGPWSQRDGLKNMRLTSGVLCVCGPFPLQGDVVCTMNIKCFHLHKFIACTNQE